MSLGTSVSHPRPLREARIDLGAISRNVETLRARVDAEHTMVVVKARGYGHGAVPSARAAVEGGADWLGVVDVAEALALRAADIQVPILAWMHDAAADFAAAVGAGVDIGVSSVAQLERVAEASAPLLPMLHLKVDTGLGRSGATLDDCAQFFARAAALQSSGAIVVRGIFSHLAGTSDADDAAQLAAFDTAVALASDVGLDPELRHIAATGGALSGVTAGTNLVRLGIGAYGLSPFEGLSSASLGLTPAMELSAGVVSIKRVPAGTGVSYGSTYRTTAETTLALIPLGYAEGIPRQASGRGPVSIGGRMFTVAGRVAMDQFVVDVGDAPVQPGDRAVLFGDPAGGVPGADDWAAAADTINYEIVTRIGGRVVHTYP